MAHLCRMELLEEILRRLIAGKQLEINGAR